MCAQHSTSGIPALIGKLRRRSGVTWPFLQSCQGDPDHGPLIDLRNDALFHEPKVCAMSHLCT